MNILYCFILFYASYSSADTVGDELLIAIGAKTQEYLLQPYNPIYWWDIYGQHEDIQKDEHAKQHGVSTIEISPCQTKPEVLKPTRTLNLESDEIFNGGSTNVTHELVKTITKKHVQSWIVSTGVHIGMSVTASAGLPGIGSFSATLSAGLSLQNENTETSDKSETIIRKRSITVLPKRHVAVNLVVKEVEVEVPWTCEVKIFPKVTAKYKFPYNGSPLRSQSLNLSYLNTAKFKGHENYVTSTAKGIYKSFTSVNLEYHIKEFNYTTDERSAEPQLIREYTIPL